MTAADQGVMAPAVLGQVDRQDSRIPPGFPTDDGQKVVRRAVVDRYDLVSKMGALRDDLPDLIDHKAHGPLTVVTRDHETDQLPPVFMYCIYIHV